MSVWLLLKQYVQDVEIANHVHFTNEAWDRIKKLEHDIIADNWVEIDERLQIERDLQAELERLQAVERAARALIERVEHFRSVLSYDPEIEARLIALQEALAKVEKGE